MAIASVSAHEERGTWTKENGAALKAARSAANISAAELGRRLGMKSKKPERRIYAWERGEDGPSRQRALALVRELHMDASKWGMILSGVEPDDEAWAAFVLTPEYQRASEEARRFVRTQWLPDDAAPTVEWYAMQLAGFAMLPRSR